MERNSNMDMLESLFEPGAANLDVDGMEDVYEIDVEHIGNEANTQAANQVNNLLCLYNNKDFCDKHPAFKKRIDSEIDSLRKLYKITKYNETLLDHLVTTIANNPSNASLYKAVDNVEGKIMAADKEIKLILNEFNKLCTSYQTEINFAMETENQQQQENSDGGRTARGSKSFIESMNAEVEKENSENQLELFEEDEQ